MPDWSPSDYLKFADERARPARDLLAQVPLSMPNLIYDLGCGPGNSSALLDKAYPGSQIIGVDNSPAMLAEARRALPLRTFIEGDLVAWLPDAGCDLLFSNATFQWVPDHPAVLAKLLKTLRAGAVLAVQMPDNLNEPSHALMREVAAHGPWADKLRGAAAARSPLLAPAGYHDLLGPLCSRLDVWQTAYNHVLASAQGIVEFVSSTGLRPFLAALDSDERTAFLDAYRKRLAEVYRLTFDGKVLLRFPRLFIVAQV